MTTDEQALLDAIARGDDATRSIYADWLEQHGDAGRAELLRLQEQPAGYEQGLRLRELAATIDIAWRMRIARARVQCCTGERCPMEWSQLAPSDRPNIRTCPGCESKVFYMRSEEERARFDDRPHVLDISLTWPHLTLDHLADLPGDATWEACALVIASGATTGPIDRALPEPLGVLAASALEVSLTVEDDDGGQRWILSAGGDVEDGSRIAEGLAGVRRFAYHASEPGELLAAWHAGEHDATIYSAWEHRGDEPFYRRVGSLRGWLRDTIRALLFPDPDVPRARATDELVASLRELLAAAHARRAALREQRKARVAAIEASIGAPGVDEADALREWEAATLELERVAETPSLWNDLASPDACGTIAG